MTKKILSVLLACLIILPIALIPALAADAATYKLVELDSSVILKPGDVITWDGEETAKYLSVTYITNPNPFSYKDDASSAAPVSNSGSYAVADGTVFTAPNEKFTFGGWKVEKITIKDSGINEITLSAVWDSSFGDKLLYILTCFIKPVFEDLVLTLVDVIYEIALIFQ